MITKNCKTCKLDKNLIQFQKRKLSNDGFDLHCKECKSEYNKKYRKENRTSEKIKLESIKWPRNKDTRKKWENLNKDKINQRRRERVNNYTEEEYIIFRDKINNHKKQKLIENPILKLKNNISTRINIALKSINESKKSKTLEILGCGIQDFKNHIEDQFDVWMNWDNYGKYNGEFNYGWDIDHKIPLSSAEKEEDIIRLNHYTNLRPLCSKINRYIKKDKLENENK